MRKATDFIGPVDAVRLTIQFRGDEMEVIKRTKVRKAIPPSAPLLDAEDKEQGVWAEVRIKGRSVYRQLLTNQLNRDAEVFTGDPERPISRVPIARPEGVLSVLVPLMAGAEEVAIVGTPTPRAPASGRPRTKSRRAKPTASLVVSDLATFPLHVDETDPS